MQNKNTYLLVIFYHILHPNTSQYRCALGHTKHRVCIMPQAILQHRIKAIRFPLSDSNRVARHGVASLLGLPRHRRRIK